MVELYVRKNDLSVRRSNLHLYTVPQKVERAFIYRYFIVKSLEDVLSLLFIEMNGLETKLLSNYIFDKHFLSLGSNDHFLKVFEVLN
jgi:hypothetical protein